MKRAFFLLVTILAACAGAYAGYSQAKSEILAGDAIFDTFEEVESGWLFSDDIGSVDATPIERARVAMGGPLGLSSSEVLYFVALKDSSGQRLSSSCTYEITGAPIDTRWWSITLYDSETQNYVENAAKRSSWNSAAIPKDDDGQWSIFVSPQPSDGNWLPSQSGTDKPFELNLRAYNPSEQTREDAPNISLPVVKRGRMLNRGTLLWVTLWVILATAGFFGAKAYTIHQAPRMVMSTIEGSVAERAGGWNKCWHNRQFGPVMGGARRANPDSVVTVMAYDLSDGPVRVSGETWPDYWSLSLYQQNSDNYYVINDRQLFGQPFDFAIALPEHLVDEGVASTVHSPTDKGIMLIRRFVKEEADMARLLENQDQMRCGPLVSQD